MTIENIPHKHIINQCFQNFKLRNVFVELKHRDTPKSNEDKKKSYCGISNQYQRRTRNVNGRNDSAAKICIHNTHSADIKEIN